MSSLLDRFQLQAERGALLLDGQTRYLVMRPETLTGFQQALETELGPEATGAVLARGGRAGGSASTKRFLDGGATPEEAAGRMTAMGAEIGWGRFELLAFDAQERHLEIRVAGSPFAEAYGVADHPVCHFIRGVVLGIAIAAFAASEGDLACIESECAATGTETCSFLVARYNEG